MSKKMIYLKIIIVSLCLLALTGCSFTKKDNSFIIDVVNDETNMKAELSTWNEGYFENKSAPQNEEFIFNDVTYTGVYEQSIIRKWESYTTNIYVDTNGIEFGFKDNTNQLVLLNLMNKNFFETEPYKEDIINSDEYALDLAKEIAESYINVEEYELIIDKPVTREKIKDEKKYYITYYTFTFAKKINNVYTSDSLAVKITSKGNLASLYVGDVGVFDNIGQKAFSISNITKANEKKIINAYQSLNYNVLEQEVDYQRLVVTPEGKLALYSSNKVSVVANKDETLLKTGICLLTYIDS